MKVWMVVAIIAGLLILGGVAVVQALDKPVADDSVKSSQTSSPSYSCGGGCGGGCTAEASCGAASCGAKTTGSCGCSR